ncbi:MAG: PadR family transcriptional regulator [Polyangiaceae bacterium]
MTNPFPSEKESLILALLAERGVMYGLELVNESGGHLKRGTVYVTLSRMQDKGWVRVAEDRSPGSHAGLPRPRYRITAAGHRVLMAVEAARELLVPARRPLS